ncbi:hypothetical protein Acr_14g0006340 [Actinidia rufa]|uniref:Retrotransposon gag domain-containing protein n=1 Tax=Actinidia rufa TaxID=165716 RepID=A0A7J0FQJ8_9ERIC|nr:hypothetical protein Acr_14g0006340 [Actinidia rufa]
MRLKHGRARMVGHGRGGRGATGRGKPIENVGDQGAASQTQQGVDRGVTSHSRRTQQGAGRGNPTPVVSEAHSGAGGRETSPDMPVIPSQFAREVATTMLEMERTRQEEICIQREIRKIFDTVRIIKDDMKVSFASYQLVREAKGEDRDMTLADFESTFEDQYFFEAYRDELRDLFKKLVHGDMTILEYAIIFQSLSRFAPE